MVTTKMEAADLDRLSLRLGNCAALAHLIGERLEGTDTTSPAARDSAFLLSDILSELAAQTDQTFKVEG